VFDSSSSRRPSVHDRPVTDWWVRPKYMSRGDPGIITISWGVSELSSASRQHWRNLEARHRHRDFLSSPGRQGCSLRRGTSLRTIDVSQIEMILIFESFELRNTRCDMRTHCGWDRVFLKPCAALVQPSRSRQRLSTPLRFCAGFIMDTPSHQPARNRVFAEDRLPRLAEYLPAAIQHLLGWRRVGSNPCSREIDRGQGSRR
jgi:hypothetical protein